MRNTIRVLISRLSWAQRFLLVSLVIFVAGWIGIAWWVGRTIESGVVHQTAGNTALFVSSVVEPNLQELAYGDTISTEHSAMFARLLQENGLGQHITSVKVWNKQGRVVYATDTADTGQTFPIDDDLRHALNGWVASDISTLDKPENVNDADRGKRRLETYSPVRLTGTDQVIAAVEFYQTVDSLDQDIAAAQRNCYIAVGTATILMYLLLAGFVRYASDTIRRQQNELSTQVVQLRSLLRQNELLHDRVRRAARRTTALNERFLRRISAELHDGPAQDLGFALLRLEHLLPRSELTSAMMTQLATGQSDFQLVQSSLRHALQEIRAISAGMGLPELSNLSLTETVMRAVRAHERRTGTSVGLQLTNLPDVVPLPAKITIYRIIQEALSNAYRHANGADQRVQIEFARNQLNVIVSDQGPGFDDAKVGDGEEHLGLAGMRERVESQGGNFRIESESGHGTRVIAQLPLDTA